ncbi:MAG: type II secretion system F family protein [Lachnospiraceae bacterium]|nr:type II secretion system F family protein [Lachnospiraceae bacterium]
MKQIADVWNEIAKKRPKTKEEWLGICLKIVPLFIAIAELFYDSLLALLFLLPFMMLFFLQEERKLETRRTELLTMHFKEMLLSMVAALKAGYSVENAFRESYRDISFRFGENDVMARELQKILRQTKNGIPVEKLLHAFAQKTDVDAIRDFADIFAIAKRSGGDMGKIMGRTISIITRQMEVKEEIRLLVAAKRYEQQIMNVVPLGILLYIRMTNPGYFDGLYHNVSGIAIMTVVLIIYALAYVLSEKILEIA